MTDATTPTIPAGWYADPANPAQQRWWDGTQWSEQVSAAYVIAEQPKAPAGTSPNTPWIWLNVLLPVLAVVSSFVGLFADPTAYLQDTSSTDPTASMRALLELYSSPEFLLSFGFGLLLIAATIVFAFLDWRELKRRGVPAPFHWAFAFFGLIGIFGAVYPIGRAVITKRRTGVGNGVLLAAILIAAAQVVILLAAAVIGFAAGFNSVLDTPGLR